MSTIPLTENSQVERHDISEAGTCLLLINKYIIIGTDNGIIVKFNNEAKTYIKKKLDLNRIECLAQASVGEFWLAGNEDIYLYHLNLTQTKRIQGHSGLVKSLKVTSDGLISASEDADVRLWTNPVSKSGNNSKTKILYSHNFPIFCMEYCKEKNIIASADSDSNLYIYSFQSNQFTIITNETQSCIWCVRFLSSQNLLLTADNDSNLILRDISNISCVIRQIKVDNSRITDVCINKQQNYIASCGFDQSVYIINAPGMANKELVLTSNDWVRAVQYINDDSELAIVGDDKNLTFCKVTQRKELFESHKIFKIWMNLATNGFLLILTLIWWITSFAIRGVFISLFLGIMALSVIIFYNTRKEIEKFSKALKYVLIGNLVIVLIVPLSLIVGCIVF